MDTAIGDLYSELKSLARFFMRGERKNHTLSATDLFHEAYFRLSPRLPEGLDKRQDVRSLFAVTMRRVLIDHARRRNRRNSILHPIVLRPEEFPNPTGVDPDRYKMDRMELLERALKQLGLTHPVHAKLVELKMFGGLDIAACSELLGISEATVQRHWQFSKAWLARLIKRYEQGLE